MPVAVMDGISVTAPGASLAVEPVDGEALAVEPLDVEPAVEPLAGELCPLREACPVRDACPVHPALLPEVEPRWKVPETMIELICDSWAAIAAGIWVADMTSLTDCELPAVMVSGLLTLALMASGAMPWP